MPVLRLLLLALLCLALLANGMGLAAAGGHGACDHAAKAQSAGQTNHAGHGGGHGGLAADDGHTTRHAPHDPHGKADAQHVDAAACGMHGEGDTDCGMDCETACPCGCLAHAQAGLPTTGPALPAPAHATVAQRRPPDHPAPTLPDPIRPPIDPVV